MKLPNSFLWHDYETFGTNPRWDRASQFAAIRTDAELKPLPGEEYEWFCKAAGDMLPQPDACMVTGITPQATHEMGDKSLREADFSRRIREIMLRGNNCSVGYNSIRFDDEFSRNLFYRNLYDPYEREWKNGNSRWDLIDLVRACYALRPTGIEWVYHEPGKPSFRLDQLSLANQFEHTDAHDALADVRATIDLARLLRSAQPRLFNWSLGLSDKKAVAAMLDPMLQTPLIHVSAKIPAVRGCTTLVLPICQHPKIPAQTLCLDLMSDPAIVLESSIEELKDRLFTPTADLPEGIERPGIKGIAANKCPFIAPLSVLKNVDQERIQLDQGRCHKNLQLALKYSRELAEKLGKLHAENPYPEPTDPDQMIYSGGFLGFSDKQQLANIHQLSPAELATTKFKFQDSRLAELLFRYRARNYPETLSVVEQSQWDEFRQQRILQADMGNQMNLKQYLTRIAQLRNEDQTSGKNPDNKTALLDKLEVWPLEIGINSQDGIM